MNKPPRNFCYNCYKAENLCSCNSIRPYNTNTRIGILQHPRERFKAIGTARLAHLHLPNSFIVNGVNLEESSNFQNNINIFSKENIGLLFPSANAIPLEEAGDNLKCLLISDGTWAHAKSIIKNTPLLSKVQHYSLTSPNPSNYRIRREPKKNYISTIEAIVYSLRILEKRPRGFKRLLESFNNLIDNQIKCIKKSGKVRSKNL